ncbi:MAG: hypothetical protein ACREQL_14075 [Candidatus Binatia bacterium]
MRHRWIVLVLSLAVARLAAAQTPTCNLNGSGPDELVLTIDQSGSDFDLGWKGKYHDLEVPGGAKFEFCLNNCATSGDSLCDVQGYAGGQTASGRSFAPPIPAVFGANPGTPVCIVTTFQEPFATGTADVATGAIDVSANISAGVYTTSIAAVCPKCSGANAGDSGTCQGGANNGAACVTGEVITVSGAGGNPYTVARECLPSGTPIPTTFTVNVTNGTTAPTGTCGGGGNDCTTSGMCGTTCTNTGHGGISQNCCVSQTGRPCFPDPVTRMGLIEAPIPLYPDPTYPKTGIGTLVSTFCVPAVPPPAGFIANPDVGLPGPAAFILPYTAAWQLDASPTTTTTTTVTTTSLAGGSTTSTTLPGGCTSDADCADTDPCTDDVCTGGTCSNPPLTGAAGVDCALRQALAAPLCTDAIDPALQAAITQFIGKADTAVQAFDAATPKKMNKLRKKAGKALSTLLKKTAKAVKKGKISSTCGDAITQQVQALQQLVAAL